MCHITCAGHLSVSASNASASHKLECISLRLMYMFREGSGGIINKLPTKSIFHAQNTGDSFHFHQDKRNSRIHDMFKDVQKYIPRYRWSYGTNRVSCPFLSIYIIRGS